MPVRIPGPKPGLGNPVLDEFWEKMRDAILIAPFSWLLALILGGDESDWDTLDEVQANLLPALIKLPLRVLVTIIGGIPVVGDDIAAALAGYIKDTNTTAVTAQSTATSAASTASAASSAASAASSAASAAQAAVGQVADNINNAVAGGAAAGSGAIAAAYDTIATIFGIADAAQKTAMAAQQQLQDIQNTTPVGGFSWSTIFAGSDGTALNSTDWPVGSSELVIRGDDGYVGIQSGAANGYYYRLAAYEFVSDTQSASFVFGTRPPLAPGYDSGVLVRSNPTGTTGAYCTADREMIQVGKFTRSGSTWTFTPFSTQSLALNQGDIVRLRASGDNYYVQVNGVTRLSVTDSGATVSKGSGFRRAGFLEQRGTQAFVQVDSFRVASFAMADWTPSGVDVSTPSWRLRKGTSGYTTLAVAGGAAAAVPSGFFTVNDLATAVTVTSLGVGQITITTAGWYELSFTASALVSVSGGTPYIPCPWGVYVGSTLLQGPILSGQVATVYLAAGDVVSPRVIGSWAASNSDGGSGTAAVTRTQGASMTRQISDIASIGGPVATFTGRKVA